MPLTTKTFNEFVVDQANGYGAALKIDPSLKEGDPALAIFETNGTQHQVQQANIIAVLAFARASTAEGADLDSFVNEFGFKRLQAQKATGAVTFGLTVAQTTEIVIPVGSLVTTKTGDIQFVVVADTTKPAWNVTRNAYIIPVGEVAISAQVEALEAGVDSNVLSDQVTKFVSSGAGPDTVTNPQPLTNGIDQESDEDCRFRFVLYINSRSKATPVAIQEAVLSLRVGLKVALTENKDQHGNIKLGYLLVVLDDGSGAPPQSLIDEAQVAVDLVRPATVEVEVIAPTIVMVDAACNIKIDPEFENAIVTAAVDQALTDYINTRQVGETLYLSSLTKIILGVEGVIAVQPNSLVVDDTEADKVVLPVQVIKTENVTVGIYS